jgi:hypothetical protein
MASMAALPRSEFTTARAASTPGATQFDRFPEFGKLGVHILPERGDPRPVGQVVRCELFQFVELRRNRPDRRVVRLEIPFVVREQKSSLACLRVLGARQQFVERDDDVMGVGDRQVALAQRVQIEIRDGAADQEKNQSGRESQGDREIQAWVSEGSGRAKRCHFYSLVTMSRHFSDGDEGEWGEAAGAPGAFIERAWNQLDSLLVSGA